MEMSLEVQLMNAQDQPSNIKREICVAIEVNFDQLFLIRSGSWDQPRRYVPPERLCFYKQPFSGSWADWGLRPGPRHSTTPRSLHGLAACALLTNNNHIWNICWWHTEKKSSQLTILPQQTSVHFGTWFCISLRYLTKMCIALSHILDICFFSELSSNFCSSPSITTAMWTMIIQNLCWFHFVH